MKTLLKNGSVVNVFTGEVTRADVLLDGERILGVGEYERADLVRDLTGCYLCPGLIDGHIHIESTMLLPDEFARAAVPHGTTAVVADPHEIANVCGASGISFLLEASESLPLTVYFTLPSCVPSTEFDEAGARLTAADLEPFYSHPRVLGLAEVMDYPAVIAREADAMEKIEAALARGLVINGHAPLLTGRALDRYIAAGIGDDHECSSVEEAEERIRKGQRVMIRQGTAAKNLETLLPLFEEPWAHRCMLVTDDKHPADLLRGHLDESIRLAARAGKNPVTGIRMATLWAAEHFGLKRMGAIAPGYWADLVVLGDLADMSVRDVYCAGVRVVKDGRMEDFKPPQVAAALRNAVYSAFQMRPVEHFHIEAQGRRRCRVIKLLKGELLTEEWITELDFDRENGVDVERDIVKLAVVERHRGTGHRGLGFLSGLGLKYGAIASSVSHDSHNLIVAGADERDMVYAAERVSALGGGCVVVRDGKTLAELPLPVAGLMSDRPADELARRNEQLRKRAYALGIPEEIEPFMPLAFLSLPVIPHLKMTTLGLLNVDERRLVPLFVDGM